MRMLVLGAGVSGMAAARLGRRLGFAASIYDREPSIGSRLLNEGFGGFAGSWDPGSLDGVELVVASPGFPERSAPITDALEAGVRVWGEVEFAWRQLTAPVIAVTGTNGKTTVTRLISEMLTASGFSAPALGNIGAPLSDQVGEDIDMAVVEVSSFQLRLTEAFRPSVAVVTNVAPDHLDWHGSLAAYADAKAQIVVHQQADDLCVYDADDPGAARVAARAPGRILGISRERVSDAGIGRQGSSLVWPGQEIPIEDLALTDPVFVINVLLAGTAALEMGATVGAVRAVAGGFVPEPHRRTPAGEIDGVLFINDSKATNPHAALSAIRSYDSVVLIAGGLSKGLDVGVIAEEPNVKYLVAIGESGPLLLERSRDGMPASSMEEAVAAAFAHAQPGDVVLLAPGCASFDMFDSYEHRGDAFSQAVRAMIDSEAASR